MEYSTRRTLFEKEKRYLLRDDALEVVDEGGATVTVPYADIAEVSLAYLPSRYHSRIYRCLVRTRTGAKIPILNTHMAGFAKFEDRSAAWSPFVRELHRRLVPRAGSIRFRVGVGAAMWGCMVFALVLLVAAAVAVGALMSKGAELTGSAMVKIAVLVVLLPLGVAYLRKNRPKSYDPAQPPADLLPGG
jgi:hypothetical protein